MPEALSAKKLIQLLENDPRLANVNTNGRTFIPLSLADKSEVSGVVSLETLAVNLLSIILLGCTYNSLFPTFANRTLSLQYVAHKRERTKSVSL
jgi:hypothetical protein